uniref:Uncharacterized protein n=1 Tax=Tanacetum cinerariifolium TaxID=118510 RepID=A0A699PY54_TANCI|nr:hypothetical protein [Tanacetum cinerariifolium]
MLMAQQVGKCAVGVNVDDVSTVGVAAEGATSVADDVPAAVDLYTIIYTTYSTTTTITRSTFYFPSTNYSTSITSSSTTITSTKTTTFTRFRNLNGPLQNLFDTCTILTRRVEHLEQDKIAQALEITKLKQRVKKLERMNKASKLRRLKKFGTT